MHERESMGGILTEILVFVGSSIILVPIFQRLGFGSVLGYLIAGVLVGPYGFKLIHEAENVAHLSEFGVVFLLFMIGLEIQPRKLWSMRRHLLGLGGLQVLLSSVVFSVLGMALGVEPGQAVVLGFALSLSSTAFAIQYLIEKNVFNTEFGRSSFSILLMQDLMAIPALAFIPAFAAVGVKVAASSPKVGLALVIIAALVVASRFLMRPLFRLVASTRSRDLFTAVTLFIVIGVAGLMQIVGLSAALGTFIAGVLLADSEYRNELEANLEPFKGLLMGLFFIAVGMGVNLQLVYDKAILILALTIGYLIIKFLIIYTVGRLMKINHENSKLMGLTIAQGGEFAFVIFSMVAQLELVESEILAMLTVVITASMALSPILNLLQASISRKWRRQVEPQYDQIKDEVPQVIIAGFGRFGQIFGRVLRAQEMPFIAIDHDVAQVELVRRFGNKVYYGDVSRKDILEAAGIAQAKYFILAIDDVEISLKTAEVIRLNFPHIKIFARARNRGHVFELMAVGVEKIKRETFDSSVYFVQDLLVDMGFSEVRAHRLIEKFRVHDELMIQQQFLVREDDKSMLSVSQQGVAQLAEVLREESVQSNIAPQTEI
jgi:monovalent cation:proton antiporter-2 (CPA2) family protein